MQQRSAVPSQLAGATERILRGEGGAGQDELASPAPHIVLDGTSRDQGLELSRRPPPPPVLRRASCVFRGQRSESTGAPSLDKPSHTARTPEQMLQAQANQGLQQGVQQASGHRTAQEHMEYQLRQRFDTHSDPSCSPHNTSQPHSPLDWNRKGHGSKQRPKGAETWGHRFWTKGRAGGVRCFHKRLWSRIRHVLCG